MTGAFATIASERLVVFKVKDGNVVQITDACLTPTLRGQTAIKFGYVRNPAAVRETGSFKISISDSVGQLLCVTQDSFGVSADEFSTGPLSEFTVTFDSAVVQTDSTATLRITPTHPLDA